MAGAADLIGLATGLQNGAGIGSAIAGLFVPGMAKKANAESDKTRVMIGDINARRVARDLRYQQGLASIQNAAGGISGSYGSALFAMADDARKKEEAVQNEHLKQKMESLSAKANLPTATDAAFNLVGSISTAWGNTVASKASMMLGQ